MPLPPPRLPVFLRPLVAAADGLAYLDLDLVPIDADAMFDTARRQTGLSDFGDPIIEEGVRVYCQSALDEANLHAGGRYHLRWLLGRVLSARLRLVALRKERPDLVRPKHPPLFVCGLPRSGTTALHRLLAAAEDARPLALFELLDPFPPKGPDRRRADTDARIRGVLQVAPLSLDAQHYMRADLPDECGHLMLQSMRAMLFHQVPAHRYIKWLSAAEHATVYRDHAVLLALLEDPDRRLVLKDPYHFGHLGDLFAAMPNAHVVQTHRDPVDTVPSLCQLLYTSHGALSRAVDPARIAEVYQDAIDVLMANNFAFRSSNPGRILDIQYAELLTDPVGLVRRIHQHFGLNWTDKTQARVARQASENPQYKHGRTPYTPEDFGLTRKGIAHRYRDYRNQFVDASTVMVG